MRFGLVSRNNVILITLFALAFGGVMFYVNASSRAQDVAQIPAAVPTPEVEPPHHGAVPATGPSELQQPPATAAAESAPPAPVDAALSEQDQQNLTRLSNQVVSAHVPEAREKAIRELASVKNQESIRALAYALSSDEEATNRIAAVSSLNSLALQGYEIGAIRDALRLAAADQNQDVAERAKDAYDDLTRKEE